MERGGYRGRGRTGNRGGRYSSGGRGREHYSHPQYASGGDRVFPSPSQPRYQRPNPSHSAGSSRPNYPVTPTQVQTPDIRTLTISEQNVENIKPVLRPDNGGTIAYRRCNLRVNHFCVSFNPQSIIMHYHVDVKPKAPPKNNRPQRISKSDLSMIRDKLFSDHSLPSQQTAYDGEKNIFSMVRLPEETLDVDISKGEDERTDSYLVNLKLVNKLELHKLRDYLSGKVFSIPRHILHGLDLIVKENPAKHTVSLGWYFFPMNPPLGERDLQPGIIAIGGFQHRIKPTSQGLSLCLDYSVSSFWKKMTVLEFLHSHIKDCHLSEFGKFRKLVKEALVGLKVNVTHRRTKQKYTIRALTTRNTRHITFPVLDPEGRNPPRDASLLGYFLERYGVDIEYKDIPALDFGGNNTNYVPMELCVLVEGQRFPKEDLNRNAAKELRNMSLAYPREREDTILSMVNSNCGPCG